MTPTRRTRLLVFIVACAVVLALIAAVVGALVRVGGAGVADGDDGGPVPVPPRAEAVKRPDGAPQSLEGLAALADESWARDMAEKTGIPLRALQAYAGIAIVKQAENPGCHLGWNTLAAIGDTESSHGQHSGSAVEADGSFSPPILGIALDGGGVDAIPDSDDGDIDGDAEWDRAVGPMQFIPESWRNWGTDASGDGVADPQNLDDSTLATANYLCRAGGDLSVDDNWRQAIASYNSARSYSVAVSAAAIRYAEAAAGA